MMEQVKGDIEKIALRVVTLDQGDIPAMGEMLNGLSSLENSAKSIENETITSIIKDLKNFTDGLFLDQETEISPLETAVRLLQEMCGPTELENNTKAMSDRFKSTRYGKYRKRQPSSALHRSEPHRTAPLAYEKDIQILGDFLVNEWKTWKPLKSTW